MTAPLVVLLSGPNLNLLGERQPLIYGTATLDDLVAVARQTAEAHGLALEHVQSNHEGALVDAVDEIESSDARAMVWRADGEVFTGGADVNGFKQAVEEGSAAESFGALIATA